ncbi:hypothetical protein CORC01_13391 [Colletotrichum orchidophilum]|uniref:Integral membrane protein n=1 Tax=Colletotrichum orchidophilum TaxID=1209926 RepID=A0A1G4AQ67_9PEZI|nr:uncharacterized protein CORC01_13391 [Colletotrichum orchidophilum]OHE91318.1 hypothetical protein CORC01_13391 [Colletotrichum orchidophilum]
MPVYSDKPDSQQALSYRDNTYPSYDIKYDLPSTKFLGTLKTMSSLPENRPLNPSVIFRSLTPPSQHSSTSSHNGSSPVFLKFIISTVALLRFIAVALSLTLVFLECDGRRRYDGLAKLFISLAILQLLWLTIALLVQGRHRPNIRNKPVIIDLGCVKCIFGRRGWGGDDDEESTGGILSWFHDDKKKRKALSWVYTALDITFAASSFTSGVIAAGDPYCWLYEGHVGIAVVAIVLGVLEAVIAIAQQFSILRRAKVQVLWDEDDEDDLGLHKYRIRLPQAPEQRHAPMSISSE